MVLVLAQPRKARLEPLFTQESMNFTKARGRSFAKVLHKGFSRTGRKVTRPLLRLPVVPCNVLRT
jgi:hypothetical protein